MSFYVFLNIAAFSVYIIVIRSNLLQVMYRESVDAMRISSKVLVYYRENGGAVGSHTGNDPAAELCVKG